jgi:hypothetical protein
MKRNLRGFTLGELLIVIIVVVCLLGYLVGYLFIGKTIIMGNMYFTESGVAQELRIIEPEVKSVLKSESHVYDFSRILVEMKDGSRETFCVDSDLLFNYNFYSTDHEGCDPFM